MEKTRQLGLEIDLKVSERRLGRVANDVAEDVGVSRSLDGIYTGQNI